MNLFYYCVFVVCFQAKEIDWIQVNELRWLLTKTTTMIGISIYFSARFDLTTTTTTIMSGIVFVHVCANLMLESCCDLLMMLTDVMLNDD